MAASRFWRITGIALPGAEGLELSALHLHGDSGRLDASATLTCSHSPASGALSALQDADVNTLCSFPAADAKASGFWLQWDFGAGVEVEVERVLFGGGDSADGFPSDAVVLCFSSGLWVAVENILVNRFTAPRTLSSTAAPSRIAVLLHLDGATSLDWPKDSGSYTHKVTSTNVLPAAASGVFAGAGNWPATGSFLRIPNHQSLVFGTGDFTVELWMKAPAAGRDLALVDFFQVGVGGWQVYCDSSGKFAFYESTPNGTVATGVTDVCSNTWHHLACSRRNGVLRLFVDGGLEASVVNTKNHVTPGVDMFVGAQRGAGNGAYDFVGYMDEVRIVKGAGLYGAAFTPASAPFADAIQPKGVFRSAGAAVFSSAVGVLQTHGANSARLAKDTAYGGNGTIRDTVQLKASPSNIPLRRRVRLYADRSGEKARETWSDATTGIYEFPGLDTAQKFTALATDHERVHQAVAADNLTPQVLP